MRLVSTEHPDIFRLQPRILEDARGFFFESYNRRVFAELGIQGEFVQDNHSRSKRGVLRGLHYQIRQPQGRLIRVVVGEVFDVAVDLRRPSSNFGRAFTNRLSAETHEMLWIPPGFAHGFLVLSDYAEFLYKTTDYYAPDAERCLAWDDPELNIPWPLDGAPLLSAKDQAGLPLAQCEVFA
ncbi:MAG: dTDP-4-dehydrorhamnose 3,5-epimerase [Thiobacillus sp.]